MQGFGELGVEVVAFGLVGLGGGPGCGAEFWVGGELGGCEEHDCCFCGNGGAAPVVLDLRMSRLNDGPNDFGVERDGEDEMAMEEEKRKKSAVQCLIV